MTPDVEIIEDTEEPQILYKGRNETSFNQHNNYKSE